MVKQGWVAIHRQIQDHWLWAEKPFDKSHAWIDMLLLANHEDKKFVLGNELVEVKQGSFITSEVKLMERWGWGKSKTRAFLDLLQSDGMIVKISDRKKTTINIVNYSDYAILKTTNRPQTDCKQTANRPQTDTNNNDNNYNNDKKKEKKERKNTTYDEILSSVADDSLRELYLEYIKMRKMIKSPMTDRALTMLIKKVNELEPTSIDRQKQLLETAIMNNWKSVYPLQGEKKPKANSINEAINKRNAVDREVVEKLISSIDNPPPTAADDENIRARAEALKKELAKKY